MQNRNPTLVQNEILRRRMFNSPVYNRNDPVGIMGSSPQLRQAVMRNRGGLQLASMNNINPLLLNASLTDVGRDASGLRFTPTEVSPMPVEDDPNITIGGNSIRGGTGGGPQQQDPDVTNIPSVTIPLPKSKPGTDTNTDTNVGSLAAVSVSDMLKALKSQKSIDKFVEGKADLLEKYAPLPKAKNLRREYLTKFFLDMAARGAQGDKLLAAAATAAPGTFDEYLEAKDKRTERESERQLLALTLGIKDKDAQDAQNQAINLEIIKLQKRPDKLQILDGLVADAMSGVDPKDPDYAIKQSQAYKDAMSQVFPDARPGATQLQIAALESLGHSRGIASLLLNAQLLKDNVNTPAYFLNYLSIPEVAANKRDADFLMGQAERAGASIEDIVAALAQAGYTLNAQGQVVQKAS
jgi:hypothetical protein